MVEAKSDPIRSVYTPKQHDVEGPAPQQGSSPIWIRAKTAAPAEANLDSAGGATATMKSWCVVAIQ